MNHFIKHEIYSQFARIYKHRSLEEECQNRVKLHVMVAKLGLDTITCHYREELQAVCDMFEKKDMEKIRKYCEKIHLLDIFKIQEITISTIT